MESQKHQLKEYIKDNQGQSIEEIAKHFGVRKRAIQDSLIEMVRLEELRVEIVKHRKHLYFISTPGTVKKIVSNVVSIEPYQPIRTLHRVREIVSVFDYA